MKTHTIQPETMEVIIEMSSAGAAAGVKMLIQLGIIGRKELDCFESFQMQCHKELIGGFLSNGVEPGFIERFMTARSKSEFVISEQEYEAIRSSMNHFCCTAAALHQDLQDKYQDVGKDIDWASDHDRIEKIRAEIAIDAARAHLSESRFNLLQEFMRIGL